MVADRYIPAHPAQEECAHRFAARTQLALLETQDEWVLHGFSFANYLEELRPKAQSEIYEKSSIDLLGT